LKRTNKGNLSITDRQEKCHPLGHASTGKKVFVPNLFSFLGSAFYCLTVCSVRHYSNPSFHRIDSGPRKGDPELINMHPQPGEPKEFLGSSGSENMTEDYALIALIRGLEPSQSVLILAGNTTMGTQAAVEYVCRRSSIEELLLRLSVSQTGQLKPFEAVIRVKVTRGVPVSSELVALRNGTA